MNDHADTMRLARGYAVPESQDHINVLACALLESEAESQERFEANQMLTARVIDLVAERDAAQALVQPTTTGTSAMLRAEIQRLRDALADLLLRAENVDVPLTRERVSDIARAALAREEDTPKRKLKATGDESWEIVNSGAEEWLAREEDTQ